MTGSVNKVILVGKLGRDPEVRRAQDNQKIVHLSVATSERWKDRSSGELKERTEWHRVVIFNPNLADVAERWLAKGRTVYLEGQLQTRKWQDQGGQERYTAEIVLPRFGGALVLLGGRGEAAPAEPSVAPATAAASATAAPSAAAPPQGWAAVLDDEVPF